MKLEGYPMGRLLSGLFLLVLSMGGTATAANQDMLGWRIDKALTPPAVCLNYSSTQCLSIGTISPSQIFKPPPGSVANIFPVEQYGSFHNFVGNDTTAINAAISAATAAGGGTVYLGPYSYWVNSANIVVPRNVSLSCVGVFGRISPYTGGITYANHPCAIYLASGRKVISQGGAIKGISILQDRVHFVGPGTTRANMQTYRAGYTGTGLEIGDSVSNGVGSGAVIENVNVGGFTECISIDYAFQVHLTNILGDCTNGLDIAQSYDDNFLTNVEFWPFLTAQQTHTHPTWAITALANNGSGLWRATTASNDITTGEFLCITAGTGGQGARGCWTVTSINSTTVDLQGSAVAPTPTGNVTNGSLFISNISSIANLAVGQTVSGTGIPAGATVGAIKWYNTAGIFLDQDHPATATNTGVTLTFGSTAYTASSSLLEYDAVMHRGIGFRLGRADGTLCIGCFAFGYEVGFSFDTALGVSITNSQTDAFTHPANQNLIQRNIQFVGNQTSSNYIQASLLTGGGIHILSDTVNTAGSFANTVVGPRPAAAGTSSAFEIDRGSMQIINLHDGATHTAVVDSSNEPAVLMGNQLALTSLYNTGTIPNWYGAGNRFSGNREWQSQFESRATQLNAYAPTAPTINVYDASQATDAKFWRWVTKTNQLCLQTATDGYATPVDVSCFTRSGTTPLITTLYAHLSFGGTAPTCSSTGTGTSPSCALGGGSTDMNGTILMTTGTGSPAALGTVTLTFSTAFTGGFPVCLIKEQDIAAGQWNPRASAHASVQSLSAPVFKWDNNAVALSVSTQYAFGYHCLGR